ncbi:hypothetical protein FKR81_04340 [Lentzea tibetensis]|uniref:Peptidase inhibitor family I36 n=1 Tax=Lentzea tibetensis TaxID=2591470 RepID=A0A563EZP8_9PSEU|nr:hypothetical protein [Lentzea tibetensis]TWP53207.1 hypothetical protein FKR81_04340 [Lentzea tibetensis]
MRGRAIAVLALVSAAFVSLVPAASAGTSTEEGYWQACTPINDPSGRYAGDVCMDVRGNIGGQGTIGTAYFHHSPSPRALTLANDYVGNPNPPVAVWNGVLSNGENTGTQLRSSWIGRGCVAYPVVIWRQSSGNVRRNGKCVNVQ